MLLRLPEFELMRAETIEHACALLGQQGARFLAGGTDLFPKMKQRRLVPRRLIDIKQIPELSGIYLEDGHLRIGALATAQAIETSALVIKNFPALSQAAGMLGTLQIRNLATIGGNLCNASPSAEFAPALLVFDASVKCAGQSGTRIVSLKDLFIGPGRTVMAPDEILVEVHVPPQPAGARSTHLKHGLRKMDVAIAGASLFVCIEGDLCSEARIALSAVGPTPFRAQDAEQVLNGATLQDLRKGLIDEAARIAADASVPIDDFRGRASYRKKLVRMLVGKGLERLVGAP